MKKSKSVPSVPNGGNGNIVIPSVILHPKYEYDFVLNNYTEDEVCQLIAILPTICKKALFGYEIGEGGTPHLQGYINLIKKDRMTGLLNKYSCFKRCTFREARNVEALIKYCQKDGKVWSYGFPKPIKVIQELYTWQKDIEDLFHTEPNDRSIYWFWESIGNIGKSAFVKYMIVKYKCLFCDGGKKADLINLIFNCNMDDCKCIIWDLPRTAKGHISYSTLESAKNGLICNTKFETGVKVFNSPHIFVFANFPPDKPEELSADRWIIKEL